MNPNDSYPIQLDRSSKKYLCPHCGKKRFVLYRMDYGRGEAVAPECGRCDRQGECGYHCPPNAYFQNNPMRREECMRYLYPERYVSAPAGGGIPPAPVVAVQPAPAVHALCTLPLAFATSMQSDRSDFVDFLVRTFGREAAGRAVERYHLGSMAGLQAFPNWKRAVVFWQIDEHNRLRTGKVMNYDVATGHRVKDSQCPVTWVHSLMKKEPTVAAQLGLDHFTLTQCFFGQHLLAPTSAGAARHAVFIVEAEKTAVIASMERPNDVWLATGGLNNMRRLLSTEGSVLRGRRVVLCPDKGCLDQWQQAAAPFAAQGLDVHYLTYLETRPAVPAGADLADVILAQKHTTAA